jgi:sodium-coupled neutral amino acid transporter 9
MGSDACACVLRDAVNGLEVEFPDVCLHYLGRNAYVVAVIFSVLTLMGACMVYWVRSEPRASAFAAWLRPRSWAQVLMSGFLFTVVDYFHDPSAGSTNATGVAAWEPTGTLQQGEDQHWHKIWNKQLVPIYLVILLFPLINFKSLTFFTKFNSLGMLAPCGEPALTMPPPTGPFA